MDLQKKIKKLREKRRLSVKEVAHALEIPESTYRGYEYGSKFPADLVPKICLLHNISFEKFFSTSPLPPLSEKGALAQLKTMESCLKEIKQYINSTIPKN